jgi:RAB6A-GEF complex partner protein 1
VTLNYIHHARGSAVEGWVTSDGKAYLVRFHEHKASRLSEDPSSRTTTGTTEPEDIEGQWSGTSIHPLQKSAIGGESVSNAVRVAINVKFSIIAIGLADGAIRLSNFPLHGKPPNRQQHLVVPDVMARGKTGSVTAIEWTSDGYAVAIGWEHGWAVMSVGGRFLAYTVGTMEHVSPRCGPALDFELPLAEGVFFQFSRCIYARY